MITCRREKDGSYGGSVDAAAQVAQSVIIISTGTSGRLEAAGGRGQTWPPLPHTHTYPGKGGEEKKKATTWKNTTLRLKHQSPKPSLQKPVTKTSG